MRYTVRVELPVAVATAWATLANLGAWPDWTPTVTRVEPPLTEPVVDRDVTVTQPGRRPVTYTIDLVEDGHRFRWGSRGVGVTQSADHRLTPTGPTTCDATLSFAMSGLLGSPLAAIAGRKIRSMVDIEAEALRAHLAGPSR